VITDYYILKGVVEHMTDVQDSGYIGGWDQDSKGFAFTAGSKIATLLPDLIPLLLDVLRRISFADFHCSFLLDVVFRLNHR
jgi:hypothetical protein